MMEAFSPRGLALLVAGLLGLLAPAQAADFLNGDFKQGTEYWKISFPEEAGTTITVSPDAADGEPALVLAVGETRVKPWQGKMHQTVTLEPGSYTLTFLARSEPDEVPIELSVWAAGGKSQVVGERKPFTLTSDWQEFIYTFIIDTPETPINVVFGNLARGERTLAFSNIRLTKD